MSSLLNPFKLGRNFNLVWFGNSISTIGSGLTSFGLSVWVFTKTGSILDFTTMVVFSTLPGMIVTPWAGSIADTFSRKNIIIMGDSLAVICTAIIGLLLWKNYFEMWNLYILLSFLSIGTALQGPAAYSTITSLVNKDQYGQASGMFSISMAVSQLIVPLLASLLYGLIGLTGIIVIDVITFIIGISMLLAAVIPKIESISSPTNVFSLSVAKRVFNDMDNAIRFLADRVCMLKIFIYIAIGGFLSGMVEVLVVPLVLSIYSETILAVIATSGAVGVLIGGLVMVVWGGPKKWTPLLLIFLFIEGMAVAFVGMTTSIVLLCALTFLIMLSSTLLNANVEALWRRKIPVGKQGSMFALEQIVEMGSIPLSAIIGGLLVHHLFEPALLPGGVWFDSVGQWFGTGKGRGTGLFFSAIGIMVGILALFSLTDRQLYNLETDIPDAVIEPNSIE